MDVDSETTENPTIIRNRVLVVGNLDQNAVVSSLLKNPSISWTDSFGGKLCKHSLDNKYYTAELEFLAFGPESLQTSPHHLEQFGPTVDALLLSFDSNDNSILNTLRNSWISHWIDEQDPNILLALTNSDVESDSFNDELREWCFENGMELIDISTNPPNASATKLSNPPLNDDDEDDHDDGFAFFQREERTGFDRVFEAIESHTWSHMKLKSEQGPTSTAAAKERQERVDEGLTNFLQMLSAIDLDDADNADEATIEKNLDNFEATLLNLRAMRERASGLADTDRREMAAKVALAFSSIMNEGDEDD